MIVLLKSVFLFTAEMLKFVLTILSIIVISLVFKVLQCSATRPVLSIHSRFALVIIKWWSSHGFMLKSFRDLNYCILVRFSSTPFGDVWQNCCFRKIIIISWEWRFLFCLRNQMILNGIYSTRNPFLRWKLYTRSPRQRQPRKFCEEVSSFWLHNSQFYII